ncbi:hypothetical protein YERSI8AC_100073 [Enterobacterales bacterium 8AC]|nr:hypothetical protein YERSI8AC_100073 [Enterobacterales bacterium 8AC]
MFACEPVSLAGRFFYARSQGIRPYFVLYLSVLTHILSPTFPLPLLSLLGLLFASALHI